MGVSIGRGVDDYIIERAEEMDLNPENVAEVTDFYLNTIETTYDCLAGEWLELIEESAHRSMYEEVADRILENLEDGDEPKEAVDHGIEDFIEGELESFVEEIFYN
jgi:hypothetical protein